MIDFIFTQHLNSCFVRIEVSVDDIFGLVHFRISSSLAYMNTRKFDTLYDCAVKFAYQEFKEL